MAAPPEHRALFRAWRRRLDAFHRDGVALQVMRPTDAANKRHCAELIVHVRVSEVDGPVGHPLLRPTGPPPTIDGTVVAPSVLGEFLRVISLATAPHVDVSVFNALWGDDDDDDDRGEALCPLGAGLCARCDAIDAKDARPVVTLSLPGQYRRRSALRMLRDALYNWSEERDSSDEYKQLREAFRAPASARKWGDEDRDALSLPLPLSSSLPLETQLVVQLARQQRPFGATVHGNCEIDPDNEIEARELEALLVQHAAEPADTRQFRIARVEVGIFGGGQGTVDRYIVPVLTTILRVGSVATDLSMPVFRVPEGTPDPWLWLESFDWATRHDPTPVRVHRMSIVYASHLRGDTLHQLLAFLRDRCGSIDELTLHWPIQDDARQRRHALQAIGATLFAPSSSVRIQTLEINLGQLTDEDVEALELGADDTRTRDVSRGALAADAATTVSTRVHAVKWVLTNTTADSSVGLVAPLLASTGVRELHFITGLGRLSCRTLKSVLQHCPSLTTLTWPSLLCDDFAELMEGSWPCDAGQRLRELCIMVAHGDAADATSAVDALLTRVGHKLRRFRVVTVRTPFGALIADSILTRCPQLQELGVNYADELFFDQLVRAFDEGRCRITKLSVDYGFEGTMSILTALKNPARAVARTLRQLKVGTFNDPDMPAITQAFLGALAVNPGLRHADIGWGADAEVMAQFRALPRQFVARLPSMRRRLALLSVAHARNSQLANLPPDVLAAIFAFAGRRVHRYAYY